MAHAKLGQPQTRRLGDLLVAERLITEDQLKQALSEQKGKTERLGSILARLGFITEEQLIGFLSRQYRIPSITLNNVDLHADQRRRRLGNVASGARADRPQVRGPAGQADWRHPDPGDGGSDERVRPRRRRVHDEPADSSGRRATGGDPGGDREGLRGGTTV